MSLSIDLAAVDCRNEGADVSGAGTSGAGVSGIDQDALSRQLAVWDITEQLKVSQASVFISGLSGLGVEIAKNICLTGVRALTIHDDKRATLKASNSNFYISRNGAPVQQTRAEATLHNLQQLNANVTVSLAAGKLDESLESLLVGHAVVVLCDTPLQTQLVVNDYCRSVGIKFIAASVRGVFASAFADFGEDFCTHDKDGEPIKELMIQDIAVEQQVEQEQELEQEQEQKHSRPAAVKKLVVTSVMLAGAGNERIHQRHGFADGDTVMFRDCGGGMTMLNQGKFKVTTLSPYSFSIDVHTSESAPLYTGNATCMLVKTAQKVEFKCLRDSLAQPVFLEIDMHKSQAPALMHLAFLALEDFRSVIYHKIVVIHHYHHYIASQIVIDRVSKSNRG